MRLYIPENKLQALGCGHRRAKGRRHAMSHKPKVSTCHCEAARKLPTGGRGNLQAVAKGIASLRSLQTAKGGMLRDRRFGLAMTMGAKECWYLGTGGQQLKLGAGSRE